MAWGKGWRPTEFYWFEISFIFISSIHRKKYHGHARIIPKEIFHFFVAEKREARKRTHTKKRMVRCYLISLEIMKSNIQHSKRLYFYVFMCKPLRRKLLCTRVTILIRQILQHVASISLRLEWQNQQRPTQQKETFRYTKLIQNGIYWAIDWLKYFFLFFLIVVVCE